MKVLITSNNEILVSPADGITGGNIIINGISYDVHAEEVTDLPEGAKDCEYIFADGKAIPNPEYVDSTIDTRLNDIEQILIELLDTM